MCSRLLARPKCIPSDSSVYNAAQSLTLSIQIHTDKSDIAHQLICFACALVCQFIPSKDPSKLFLFFIQGQAVAE